MSKAVQLSINPIDPTLRQEFTHYVKEHKLTHGKLLKILWLNFNNPEAAYTEKEQELINKALTISGLSFSDLNKKAVLKIARNLVNNNKTNLLTKININSRTSSRAADLRVAEAVNEMIEYNNIATEWFERKRINQKSVSEYSKEQKRRDPSKLSLSLTVIKRYLDSKQHTIDEHHAKYSIKPDHNSKVFNYNRTNKTTDKE